MTRSDWYALVTLIIDTTIVTWIGNRLGWDLETRGWVAFGVMVPLMFVFFRGGADPRWR